MALRPVRTAPSDPLQLSVIRRRGQIRAVARWLRDQADGRKGCSLQEYCRLEGVGTRGIRRVLRDPRISAMLEETLMETAREGLRTAASELGRRLDEVGGVMDTRDVIAAGEFLAKLKAKAFGRREEDAGPGVVVQINLPGVDGYAKALAGSPAGEEARKVIGKVVG